MRVTYGSHQHAQAENWFRFEYRFRYNSLGLRQSQINRATIWGTLVGTSQSDIKAKIAALENAYAVNGLDLIVLLNDDTTSSRHVLLNADTIDGVQVKDISWLDRDPRHGQSGTEYVNKRMYRIILESEKIGPNPSALTAWEESVFSVGTGGPIFIQKGALTGPPQRQTIQLQSSYSAIQTGRAVGYLGYPAAIASPIWPGDEHVERRQIITETPKFGARLNTEFPIRWRYTFESASALTGGPTFF